MFRKLSGVNIVSANIDKVWDTYTNVLGLREQENHQYFEKGRYRQRTFRIGDVSLWLLESLDPRQAPGPGGGMARYVERFGEGLYMITLAVGDEPERYSQRLESKGIKVYWDVPDSGKELAGAPRQVRPQTARPVHPLVHPRGTHGVLYELGRHDPTMLRRTAPPTSAFKRVMSISIVCRDNDQALKTYVEGLELDPPVRSTVFEEGRYKQHTLTLGDVALELVQPLDGPGGQTRGGDMARHLQQKGEGLYMVAVDVTDPVKYAKGLEAKGV